MAASGTILVKNPPYYNKQGVEVVATPAENIEVVKAIQANDKSPSSLDTTIKLMTKAPAQ
jgi:hypothetical protein